ncbi:MAG: virulence factor SrfB [Rhodobacteraceae bacterium]|nr:virulence factor SrfB [Paracoccaceae bacterium]
MTRPNRVCPTLRRLPEWQDEVSIIPYSGVQLLDFGFDMAHCRTTFAFAEVLKPSDSTTTRGDLIPLTGDDSVDETRLAGVPVTHQRRYDINLKTALPPFLGKWMPVPVLRIKRTRGPGGQELYDPGPTTWARLRVCELDQPDAETGHTHRVQLALDTALVPRSKNPVENPNGIELAPGIDDAVVGSEFRFVHDPARMDWFLSSRTGIDGTDPQAWVGEWIKTVFDDYLAAHRRHQMLDEDNNFEHWARYLAFLQAMGALIQVPLLKLMNGTGRDGAVPSVEVDLVIDVGNSRTCGLLVEKLPNERGVDLAKSFSLALRDLSRPEFSYSGLLDSRVEFAAVSFGEDSLARRSGRTNSFVWPSIARIGPEAQRLVQQDRGTESMSGLSSPKRYLWALDSQRQDWRFHGQEDPQRLPRNVRAVLGLVNEQGDVLAQLETDAKERRRSRKNLNLARAQRPRFSRSSLFGFLLAEIICHATVQINDPGARAGRSERDLPRRLRRIILTLPSATPIQEQAIIRSRAEGAVNMIWQRVQATGQVADSATPPQVIVQFDEASCTQMVWLYNEVSKRFLGRAQRYLEVAGRPRGRKGPGSTQEPSLRVCSIDIGGGTTDMVVTSYFCDANRRIVPFQNVREGFRIAGDDVLARVIKRVLLPQLAKIAQGQGAAGAQMELDDLFGGDYGDQDQRRIRMRQQAALQLLTPLAIALLDQADRDTIRIECGAVLGIGDVAPLASANPLARLLGFIEEPLRRCGAIEFRLADCVIDIRREAINKVVREVLSRALDNMVELIDHLGCDVVLLSGRPSRLPVVRDMIESTCVVRPDQLIAMHDYQIGDWYPFRERGTQRIGDPKTTVAVGAMLIGQAENRLEGFSVETRNFVMKSTVAYIGIMEPNGQIPAKGILFDVEPGRDKEQEIKLYRPEMIGSRQLPLDRWTTTPLYRLDFPDPEALAGRTPLQVTLAREGFYGNLNVKEDGDKEVLRNENQKEAIGLVEALDVEGHPLQRHELPTLRMQTLGGQGQYWLDTGNFSQA